MCSLGHRRQVTLFLVAVVVPSLVVVALGLRMIGQERELDRARLEDERRRLLIDIRQDLLSSLERIKLRELAALTRSPEERAIPSYGDPAVVLVSRVEDNRLVLPWEADGKTDEFQQSLDEGEFAHMIQRGEREELVVKQFGRAVQSYHLAMQEVRHPVQLAYAQLLLARALAKSGSRAEAHGLYTRMLSLPSDVIDDQGVPLSLYAAERLLEAGIEHETVLRLIQTELDSQHWLPPGESYELRQLQITLLDKAPEGSIREAATYLKQRIDDEIRLAEQALALQNDFPTLMLIQDGKSSGINLEPVWLPYGEHTWLVSRASAQGVQPVVIVISAAQVFNSLASRLNTGEIQFGVGSEAKGELLGESFPGLKVSFAGPAGIAPTRAWDLRSYFYFAALLLVLSVTSFGAYLVWQNLRREQRLAELRSQFVSSVSHELKTPLTAIRMFAETLRMRRAADHRTQAEYLDTIVNESERLTRLLNNVLDFAKIEQGKKTYHLTQTSLAEVVKACAGILEYPFAQQGFQLRVDVENCVPQMKADPDALQQAILNLLTNAMKYSGESREIDLRLERRNGEAVINVSDRGVGIAPEEQNRIFEKFYRVPTPENKLIPGTGLGLTLVDHVARAHGGHVEVNSVVKKGSTFSIHLPLGVTE